MFNSIATETLAQILWYLRVRDLVCLSLVNRDLLVRCGIDRRFVRVSEASQAPPLPDFSISWVKYIAAIVERNDVDETEAIWAIRFGQGIDDNSRGSRTLRVWHSRIITLPEEVDRRRWIAQGFSLSMTLGKTKLARWFASFERGYPCRFHGWKCRDFNPYAVMGRYWGMDTYLPLLADKIPNISLYIAREWILTLYKQGDTDRVLEIVVLLLSHGGREMVPLLRLIYHLIYNRHDEIEGAVRNLMAKDFVWDEESSTLCARYAVAYSTPSNVIRLISYLPHQYEYVIEQASRHRPSLVECIVTTWCESGCYYTPTGSSMAEYPDRSREFWVNRLAKWNRCNIDDAFIPETWLTVANMARRGTLSARTQEWWWRLALRWRDRCWWAAFLWVTEQ